MARSVTCSPCRRLRLRPAAPAAAPQMRPPRASIRLSPCSTCLPSLPRSACVAAAALRTHAGKGEALSALRRWRPLLPQRRSSSSSRRWPRESHPRPAPSSESSPAASDSSFTMSVFLISSASSTVLPLIHSVASEELAMAEPQPKVLNLASSMTWVSGFTRICRRITSPHSGAPTRPVPTSVEALVQLAHVARIVVVVDYLVAVCHWFRSSCGGSRVFKFS